ncbi:MAG: hypothetical protein V7731_02825 [Amphritea sp.]
MNLASLILILAFMLHGNALASESRMEKLDYEACRVLVEAGEILSMAELMELVKSMSEGRIVDTRLLKTGQHYIYEMEVAGSDGMVKMLYVNARNGAVSHLEEGAFESQENKES